MGAFLSDRRQALKSLLAVAAQGLAAQGFASMAWGQGLKPDWPAKPVRLVVPFQAGGGTDVIARLVGEALSRRIGQPVIVDNRGGAGGIIGTDAVAKATADGYTLLFTNSASIMTNQFLYSKLPYNPQRDFALLTQVVAAPVMLVVHPDLPVTSMKSLLAHVKSQRGKLAYGSWGNGSYAHLAGAYISKLVDGDMTHVAYKGEAPMIQDVIGGNLPMAFASVLTARPYVEAGRLKPIGLTGRRRTDALPAVPTIHEQGVADEVFSVFGWLAMAAPAGLPKAIEDALYAHLSEIAKDPRILERFEAAGFTPMMNSPLEFRQNYQRDMPVWKRLVEVSEARLD